MGHGLEILEKTFDFDFDIGIDYSEDLDRRMEMDLGLGVGIGLGLWESDGLELDILGIDLVGFYYCILGDFVTFVTF